MHKPSNAHIVLNSRDRTLPGGSGVYNNMNLANPGQNIVQGAMRDIQLAEVLFPYDIPNIQEGYNVFELQNGSLPGNPYVLFITVLPGFYTGAELRAAINTLIDAAALAEGVVVGDYPVLSYDTISNRFTFNSPVNFPVGNSGWDLTSPFTFAQNYLGVTKPALGKDILSIMGFNVPGATGQIGTLPGTPPVQVGVGGSAALIFTQYIDICSPKFCSSQFVRDGTTTSLPRRVDLICRLYIADEISIGGGAAPLGTRPFVIHRQFVNERIMRNTNNNSINDVDILLYDDVGQPLTTTWLPRDFQITFHVSEAQQDEALGVHSRSS